MVMVVVLQQITTEAEVAATEVALVMEMVLVVEVATAQAEEMEPAVEMATAQELRGVIEGSLQVILFRATLKKPSSMLI